MIDDANLSLISPENAAAFVAQLGEADIAMLVARLDSQEDKIRYPAFLLLRARSAIYDDVYPFWDLFVEKFSHENSYQRSLGAMLLAANARHDKAGNMRACLPRFLALLNDPKPITVRQCAQALPEILRAQPELSGEISKALVQVDLMQFKETMRKLILVDFLDTLLISRTMQPSEEVEQYIFSALSGSILDEKSKKLIRQRLG
jgi:hypothetical protein